MKEKHFKFLRWAPVIGSLALMILVTVVSMATVSELKKTTYWREHAVQELLDAQAVEDRLMDAQDSVDNYVRKGQANLLIEYKNDTNIDFREFNALAQLTRGEPEQQRRLQNLATAVEAVFANDNQIIGIYAHQGSNAAQQAVESPNVADTTGRAIHDLAAFTDEEKARLQQRDATEQKDYHRATRLLIGGSLLIAALLVLANAFAGREMARRRRAEQEQCRLIEKLQTALADVKTLSGLIPICGWCKSIRNDAGYWQSIEQYIRANTEATFTHGICPSCQEKFKADILKGGRAPNNPRLPQN